MSKKLSVNQTPSLSNTLSPQPSKKIASQPKQLHQTNQPVIKDQIHVLVQKQMILQLSPNQNTPQLQTKRFITHFKSISVSKKPSTFRNTTQIKPKQINPPSIPKLITLPTPKIQMAQLIQSKQTIKQQQSEQNIYNNANEQSSQIQTDQHISDQTTQQQQPNKTTHELINDGKIWKESDFEYKQKLGKGRIGEVFLANEIKTNQTVAIKKMDYINDEMKQKVNNEYNMMQDIYKSVSQAYPDQFLHVVQPHGFFISDDGMKAFIVMEFLAGGDLRKYLN